MSEQTIQSQDINIAEVFQRFYAVPDYQREYVWETEQVEQLLEDVNAELADNDSAKAPEYFIGSIVVCPGNDGVLDLIDGQQRMTTLFLILCALRDRIKTLDEDPPGAIGSQIADTSTDVSGRDQFRYRIDLQYEDSDGILVHIAQEELTEVDGVKTRSTTNIHNAYHVVLRFLEREFEEDVDKLRSFYGYVTNKVKLIRIQTEDVAKALKIFETINDRGVGLDSMDLLKNLIFMNADRTKFEKIKDIWKDLQDTIFEMKEKPLRFLRYFILSRYKIKTSRSVLREDETYVWFSKNEKQCGYGSDPIAFVEELLDAARDYQNFWKKDFAPNGSESPYLQSLRLLAGGATRQHLILLLAGRHLSKELFNRLVLEIENMLFVSFITREPARDLERNFASWAGKLREVNDKDGLNAFINNYFVRAKADRSKRFDFDTEFRALYTDSIQKYRLRYILAELTQHIELNAYGDTEERKWLNSYTNGFEIEHIFPQQPNEKAKKEFGDFEDEYIADRLGNLVLVEKSINASLGNRPYSEKREVYPQSQLLLTRALPEQPKIGVNTKIDRAVAKLEPFEIWNEDAVTKRQEMLATLARSVWGLPKTSKKRRTR